jgi:hypothetical protein
MSKIKGYVIYEGASQLNGEPIVAIVTLNSNNIKTGNMASMWILHRDVRPTEASKTGDDEAVCGMCPHRHNLGGACYVTLFQAPLQVFKSYHKGNYPTVNDMTVFEGMSVRFGAYGDPMAVPVSILARLKAVIKNNTSYTHQWRKDNDVLKTVSMASTDSIEETIEAQRMGWRTFRVTNDIDTLLESEIICPNTTRNVQCIDCGLCKGTSSKGKSIVIEVHGAKKNKFAES